MDKQVKFELAKAISKIGLIEPWYDEKVSYWVFEHYSYPISYSGDSKEEVIKGYPKYLQDFIDYMLKKKLDPKIRRIIKNE